ncbi:hypothetical protein ACS0TY_015176 [Phlomoides rotata]
MTRATKRGLFQAAEIGAHRIRVSHLQFVDDTIFIGDASTENAWTMKRILQNLEILSGLRVNFEKCSLSGANVEADRLATLAGILGYNTGSIPFSYLGIKSLVIAWMAVRSLDCSSPSGWALHLLPFSE